MTAEEIAEAVAAGVAAVMAALPAPTAPVPRLLYTFEQASEATGLPERWFKEKAAAQEIPSWKGGTYRRITAAQLMALIEAYEVKPTSGPRRHDLIKALAEIKAKAALAA
jgi:excisionase family DNA binding protein